MNIVAKILTTASTKGISDATRKDEIHFLDGVAVACYPTWNLTRHELQ